MKNTNISTSAVNALNVLKKLYTKDCKLDELLDGFSDDTLRLYLNTFKNCGLKISSPNKNSHLYSIKDGLNFLNFDDNDIKILSDVKMVLAQNFEYKDVIYYNNFLSKISQYTDCKFQHKLQKIISDTPFGVNLHEKLNLLQRYIDENTPLLLGYNSPNSAHNFYKVLPKCLKLENSKIYLWCFDNSIKYERYLPVKRILDIKPLNEPYECDFVQNSAICEFFNSKFNFSDFEKFEIINNKGNAIVVRISYSNIFEFIQKILSYGTNCQIIEPSDLRNVFYEKITLMRRVYNAKV